MSADDNAPEQAREVEVVRGVLRDHGVQQGGGGPHSWRCDYPDRYGECDCLDELAADLQAALAPIRAAERQEAARAALIEAAEDLSPGNGHALTIGAHSKSHVASNAVRYLRDRADGVTGRSGT